MVLRGRSQLAELFVWFVPPVRIDRLIALLDSGGRGAWPFFVRGVVCPGYFRFCVHFEKEERRGKRKSFFKHRKQEKESKKREREKEKREEEKKEHFSTKKSQNPKKPPDQLSHHDSKKKKTAGMNYSACFFRKFRISPIFQLIP